MSDYILGLNLPIKNKVHESGVALIDNEGNIIFAANEERFSRIKLDGDFPEKSIEAMLDYTGINRENIKYVAVPTLNFYKKVFRFSEFIIKERLRSLIKISNLKSIAKLLLSEAKKNFEFGHS